MEEEVVVVPEPAVREVVAAMAVAATAEVTVVQWEQDMAQA
jgi:hypothetical protein